MFMLKQPIITPHSKTEEEKKNKAEYFAKDCCTNNYIVQFNVFQIYHTEGKGDQKQESQVMKRIYLRCTFTAAADSIEISSSASSQHLNATKMADKHTRACYQNTVIYLKMYLVQFCILHCNAIVTHINQAASSSSLQ